MSQIAADFSHDLGAEPQGVAELRRGFGDNGQAEKDVVRWDIGVIFTSEKGLN